MINEATAALNKLGNIVSGLDAIDSIAKRVLGGELKNALEAVNVISSIVEAIRAGFDGTLTAEAVHEEIKALRTTILSNDDAADQALRDKFGK